MAPPLFSTALHSSRAPTASPALTSSPQGLSAPRSTGFPRPQCAGLRETPGKGPGGGASPLRGCWAESPALVAALHSLGVRTTGLAFWAPHGRSDNSPSSFSPLLSYISSFT